jgi:hypothetical protein
MARENCQQIKEENEQPFQVEVVESKDGDDDEQNTIKNIEKILHVMGLTTNIPGSAESSLRNLNKEIGLDNLINAHLEDLFCHYDKTVFKSDKPDNQEDAKDNPDEKLRWFPFKNKMVSFFSFS